jgi:hypothetical protein
MKKAITPMLIILILGQFGYVHKDYIIDNTKFLIHNPAEDVLNSNVPERDSITSYNNEVYGAIKLFAGTDSLYGLRHILARHTSKYFINFKNKNKETLFADDVTGKDIMLGIDEFYKNCIVIGPYNRSPERNISYVGFTEINNKRLKCLLVVRKLTNEIVTFYSINEVSEEDILADVREQLRPRFD